MVPGAQWMLDIPSSGASSEVRQSIQARALQGVPTMRMHLVFTETVGSGLDPFSGWLQPS